MTKYLIQLLLTFYLVLLVGCETTNHRDFDKAFRNKQEALDKIQDLTKENQRVNNLLSLSLKASEELFKNNLNTSERHINKMLELGEGTDHYYLLKKFKSNIVETTDFSKSNNESRVKYLQSFENNCTSTFLREQTSEKLILYEERAYLLAYISGDLSMISAFNQIFPDSKYKEGLVVLYDAIRGQQISDSIEKESYINDYKKGSYNKKSEYIDPFDYRNMGKYKSYSNSNDLYINPNSSPNKVYVKGYYRKNGTYVKPHIRTAPNNTKTDNLRYRN